MLRSSTQTLLLRASLVLTAALFNAHCSSNPADTSAGTATAAQPLAATAPVDAKTAAPVGPGALDLSASVILRSPQVMQAAGHDTSPPLTLIPARHGVETNPEHEMKLFRRPRAGSAAASVDPIVQNTPGLQMPAPLVTFGGLGVGFPGYTVSVAPPDTNGDVGLSDYVQTVNSQYVVFDKATQAVRLGPIDLSTLWGGFAVGGCDTNNDGDPVVLYDQLADRWFITQFSVTGGPPYFQCMAVSQTSDPTGAFNRYAFGPFTVGGQPGFNDYGKFSAWIDGYYAMYHMFANGTTWGGAKVCGYDRANMLLGNPATEQCFELGVNYGGLLPVDLEGFVKPPLGTPAYFFSDENAWPPPTGTQSAVEFWKFHSDWTTPANTTLTGPTGIIVSNFINGCNAATRGACIPQQAPGSKLEALGDRLMFRSTYRNYGTYESLLVARTVETSAGAHTGIRWYELRSPSAGPTLFQSGTYAPDNNWRWTPSIAQDQAAGFGLGLSVSGTGLKPQVHYTGRLPGDAAGTMGQGEGTVINGAGVQNGGLARWGDYADLVIDPKDDCTFWFTTEYINANGSFNWSTRIATFKYPNCAANDFTISVTPPTANVARGGTVNYTVTTGLARGAAEPIVLNIQDLPAGVSGAFNPPTLTGAGTSTLTLTATAAAALGGPIPFTVIGTAPSAVHPAGASVTVVAGGGGGVAKYVISALANPTASGAAASFTLTAVDATNATVTTYAGTAKITSSDATATLPPNPTFVAGVASNVPITFRTVGTQSVTATDTTAANINGTASTTVTAAGGPPVSYVLTGLPASIGSGSPTTFTVTAKDSGGNTASGYSGTARITSSDPAATLPGNPTFVAGVASNVAITFKTLGAQTVTATDTTTATLKGSASTTVTAGPPVSYVLTGLPASIAAGTATTFTVTAKDVNGNTATGYSGAAQITSSDVAATLPGNPTFTAGVASNVPITFKTAGNQTVTATDTVTASLKASASTNVTAGTATSYALTGLPASIGAGAATSFTVTARDSFGNTATGYAGTAKITSSDGAATLPANPTFTAGVASNVPITFKSIGSRTVTATDTVSPNLSATGTTTVNPGAVASYALSGLPASVAAGSATSFTVTAKDAFGNTATGYAGPAVISSTDGAAILPGNQAFTAGVAANVAITFKTAGTQSVTAADSVTPSIKASGSTTVTAGSAAKYVLSGLAASVTAGTATSFKVTAQDAFGNTATGYAGSAVITSSDAAATLPANQVFTAGVAANVPITLKTVGTPTVTATDATTPGITATASTTVVAGPVVSYAITGLAASVAAGTSTSFTVSAQDAAGNVVTTYAGTAAITSSDAQAAPVPNVVFTSGVAAFVRITFKTAGAQTLTATDIAAASIKGSAGTTVTAGAVSTYALSGLAAAVTINVQTTFKATATDAFGNPVSSYTGTAAVTSSDAQAVLPANPTFVAGVANAIPITFKTAGAQTVTVKDIANAALSATGSTTVSTGVPTSYAISGLPASIPAGQATSFTVTAKDGQGNVVSSYTGPANLTSTDAQATLAASVTFVAGVASSVPVTFKTAGTQSVTAKDPSVAALTATASTNVVAGRRKKYVVSGLATTVPAGTATTFSVTAQDANGNVAIDYAGTAAITASDTRATLPANPVFAQGVASNVSITFATAGSQTVTATDTTDATLTVDAVTSVTAGADGGTGNNGKVKQGCGCGSSTASVDMLGLFALMAVARRLAQRKRVRA